MMARMAFVSAIICAVAMGAAIIRPHSSVIAQEMDIEALLPDHFGDWTRVDLGAAILPAEAELGPGEAVAYRAFSDKAGRVVTLVVAYGPPLGDSVRLHRPESCYVAQGFAIIDRRVDRRNIAGGIVPIIRLRTEGAMRREAVSYLLRDGDAYVEQASGHEILNVKRGLSHHSDGALIRLSSTGDSDAVFEMHSFFMDQFTTALTPAARAVLLVERS